MSAPMQRFPLPPTQFFDAAPSVRLAYAIVQPTANGEDKRAPVVLLIGWTGVKEDWSSLPSILASLGHAVLVIDHRGMGESSDHDDAAAAGGRYTLDQLADDAAALTRHVFKEQKVHVMGISMGGMIAQLYAGRHTSLVRTLILGCTTLSVSPSISGPVATPLDMPLAPPSTPAEHRALIARLLAHNYTPEWVAAHREQYEFLVDEAMRWKRPMLGMMQQNGALGRFSAIQHVDAVKTLPVLIIHGEKDQVIPVRQGRVLADRLPNAEIVILPGVGHLFWIQEEKASKAAIEAFLKKHEEAARLKMTDDGKDATANGSAAAATNSNGSGSSGSSSAPAPASPSASAKL